MKAPVDYPLDACTLLNELQGDELTHLSMLDRVEANAPTTLASPTQTALNSGVKRRRINEKPAVIDAPMNITGNVQTTPQAKNSNHKGVFSTSPEI